MTEEELEQSLIDDARNMGYEWTAQYIKMFGYKEPLYGTAIFESHFAKRERIAKECVEKRKTATELGYYPRKIPKNAMI